MKKLLPILLIVVIVFNFILVSNVVYADPGEGPSSTQTIGGDEKPEPEKIKNVMDKGEDENGNSFKHSNKGVSLIGMILQYISSVINSFPTAIQRTVTMITIDQTLLDVVSGTYSLLDILLNVDNFFTIEKTVFNEIPVFNINIFEQDSTYKVGIGDHEKTLTQSSANISIKKSAAGWFYTCRIIAMMINLCVLIYVGIRMALSTIASEETKYKKMLIDWLQSMLVLFLLHYIMIFIVGIGESVLNIIYEIRENMIAAGEESFETTILQKIYWAFTETSGTQFFMYSVFFWFLTFMQLKFFLSYFKRMLTIMFLTMIGPFITVTYPIDKMGDGKAQAFEYWSREYVINVVIQPIHAAIYLIFVFTAGKIAEQAPWVAMIFLLTLGKVENIIRKVFGLDNSILAKNIDDEMKKKK